MSKHTPGPWTVSVGSTGRYRSNVLDIHTVAKRGEASQGIATVITIKAAEANARLIAAAPDLLDALLAEQEWRAREADGEIDPEWNYERMVGDKRRAAIAKAENAR